MSGLPLDTWIRLFVWMAIGLLIYFVYGMHHSRVGHKKPATSLPGDDLV